MLHLIKDAEELEDFKKKCQRIKPELLSLRETRIYISVPNQINELIIWLEWIIKITIMTVPSLAYYWHTWYFGLVKWQQVVSDNQYRNWWIANLYNILL